MHATDRDLREVAESTAEFRLSEIISALSYSLDLTEGQSPGHSARACVIGMRMVEQLGLDPITRSDLFYALLMKDAGCSSNAARLCALFGADDHRLKRDHKLIDWTRLGEATSYAWRHTHGDHALDRVGRMARIAATADQIGREMIATRCERGADVVKMIGLSPDTAAAIRGLDEHWDGRGQPLGLAGDQIPFFSRVMSLAQTFDAFARDRGLAAGFEVVERRSGTWFDPTLVRALLALRPEQGFWAQLQSDDPHRLVEGYEPEERTLLADERRVDQVAEGFAVVIDAKSPYTFRHSTGVAAIAVDLGERIGLEPVALRELRRAALLHDIGKLGVSNTILDKPGKLTDAEWVEMRLHPAYTYDILNRIGRFRAIAQVAAAHHERLDGKGYHQGLSADQLSLPARILAVADITEALQAERPYRAALGWEEVTAILGKMSGTAICPAVFEALRGA